MTASGRSLALALLARCSSRPPSQPRELASLRLLAAMLSAPCAFVATATVQAQPAPTFSSLSSFCQIMPAPEPLAREVKLLPKEQDCTLIATIARLEASPPAAKGEFESTTEHAARLANTRETSASGLPLAEEYAVAFPSVLAVDMKYDADAEKFVISSYHSIFRNMVINQKVMGRNVTNSHYQAENAFGAHFDIMKERGDTYEVSFREYSPEVSYNPPGLFSSPEERKRYSERSHVRAEVPCSRAEAPGLRDQLAMVVVGTSPIPAIRRETQFVWPQVDNPFDLDVQRHILVMRQTRAFLIRRDTGAVLLRFAFADDGRETLLPVGVTPPAPASAGQRQEVPPPPAAQGSNSDRRSPPRQTLQRR